MLNYTALPLALVVLVSLCVAPGGQTNQNCREVQQPYVEQECSQVSESEGGTCALQQLSYTESLVEETTCSKQVAGYSCEEETSTCELTLTNTGLAGGRWGISTDIVINNNKRDTGDQSYYVDGSSAAIFRWSLTHSVGSTIECRYEITQIPEATVCEKCEDVTKYRTVEICE